jgi:hypothetical protein
MIYIDLIDNKIFGTCKVSDIKKYGLIEASCKEEEWKNY